MAKAGIGRRLSPGWGSLFLLFGVALVLAGVFVVAAIADMHAKLAAVETAGGADQMHNATLALAEARQTWLSVFVGLLAAVVLVVFLQVVRLARRPMDSLPETPRFSGDE